MLLRLQNSERGCVRRDAERLLKAVQDHAWLEHAPPSHDAVQKCITETPRVTARLRMVKYITVGIGVVLLVVLSVASLITMLWAAIVL